MRTSFRIHSILDYPTPGEVHLMERLIRGRSGKYTKTQLWKLLRGKMAHRAFCIAFSYLEETHRISRDGNGAVHWL